MFRSNQTGVRSVQHGQAESRKPKRRETRKDNRGGRVVGILNALQMQLPEEFGPGELTCGSGQALKFVKVGMEVTT
jgi:hypothetical protein